jgi:hypothetical protein
MVNQERFVTANRSFQIAGLMQLSRSLKRSIDTVARTLRDHRPSL